MFNPILLQGTSLIPTADTTTIYITVAIIVGFILMMVIGSLVGNPTGKSSSAKKISPRAGKRKFRKLAEKIGVTPMQIKLLESLANKYKIFPPFNFIIKPNIYTNTMKKAIQEYDSGAYSPEMKENYKLLLFSVKQKLDRIAKTEKRLRTSSQFSSGKNITITNASGNEYSANIVTNLKNALCVEVLEENRISPNFSKRDNVQVSLWEKGNKGGYNFESKIIGFNIIKNKSCIMLQHSNSLKYTKSRSFPRKILDKSCYFYKINIVVLKGKEKKAVIEDAHRRIGTIIEISAGGCSIRTTNILNKGDLLKLEFDISRKQKVFALGKVVKINKIGINGIMHIQFTKMSKANMNLINSYIYDID